jgi:hypothetical protein
MATSATLVTEAYPPFQDDEQPHTELFRGYEKHWLLNLAD